MILLWRLLCSLKCCDLILHFSRMQSSVENIQFEKYNFFLSNKDLGYVLRLSLLSSFQMWQTTLDSALGNSAAFKGDLSLTGSLLKFFIRLFNLYNGKRALFSFLGCLIHKLNPHIRNLPIITCTNVLGQPGKMQRSWQISHSCSLVGSLFDLLFHNSLPIIQNGLECSPTRLHIQGGST